MDEDVPWLYSIAIIMIVLIWTVGAVTFGLAHLNAQVSAHRGAVLAGRGGSASEGAAFGAAYYSIRDAPSWSASEAERWGSTSLQVTVPFASYAFGRPMTTGGGAFASLERFYPGPASVWE
ncbi:MAG: hypothetical protein JXB47_15500 [Anaerolineae bacterium]|nr:hypothetical protein [Anaerolineae bacterium]